MRTVGGGVAQGGLFPACNLSFFKFISRAEQRAPKQHATTTNMHPMRITWMRIVSCHLTCDVRMYLQGREGWFGMGVKWDGV